jgi:hypothetical protein
MQFTKDNDMAQKNHQIFLDLVNIGVNAIIFLGFGVSRHSLGK